MDLEQWVTNLLSSIKIASDIDANFTLNLDIDTVKKIADAYDNTEWIEIY